MTKHDLELQEATFNWISRTIKDLGTEDMDVIRKILLTSHDVSAAARFLDVEKWELELQEIPVLYEDFYLGRSIHVRRHGETSESLPAWVVSDEDDQGHVEIVVRTQSGTYHRLLADGRALVEDGTAAVVLNK